MSDPTRQVCARCNRRGWGFHSPDHIWDAVAGHAWYSADICVFCFGQLGDEKWIVWTEGLKIMPVSMREQRDFVDALIEKKCICVKFTDTGGFRIADLACPIHGIDGTSPGDWQEDDDE